MSLEQRSPLKRPPKGRFEGTICQKLCHTDMCLQPLPQCPCWVLCSTNHFLSTSGWQDFCLLYSLCSLSSPNLPSHCSLTSQAYPCTSVHASSWETSNPISPLCFQLTVYSSLIDLKWGWIGLDHQRGIRIVALERGKCSLSVRQECVRAVWRYWEQRW